MSAATEASLQRESCRSSRSNRKVEEILRSTLQDDTPCVFTRPGELVILEGAQRAKDLVNENRAVPRVATGKVEEILRSTLQDDTLW